MAADRVVVDTITKIMDRMSSLPDFGHKTIIESIKRYLSTIKEVAEHSDDAATPSMNWLFGVTDALNDLWGLLEDQDLPKQSNNIASFFSPCSRTSHRRRTLLLELEQIEKQLVAADSTKALPKNTEKLRPNSGQETEMVGREYQKEDIISQVLALAEAKGSVNVVKILGMQGIGKTTLVRCVCRDDRVRRSFDGLVIWVDGIHSEVYAKSIFKCIIRRMKKKDDKDLKLGKALSRRFLLVLDDLQSETLEEWITLKQMLTKEASSSITFTSGTILVTTQNFFVAQGATGSGYIRVQELGEVDSWALFERIAGEGGGGSRGLKIKDAQMKKMVKKCGGVPIAIVKMARMLKFSEAITEPDIEHLEEELMREMKLIYYDELPSWHQKQCFAYLSMIFPSASDSVHKNTLIRLWMAEGFLGQLQPEVLGDECLEEFIRRSILCCDTYKRGKVSRYPMYSMYSGLMLELSRFVAGKDCFCMDYDEDDNVKEIVRRVVLTPDFDVSNGIPKLLSTNNKNLRSIIFLMPDKNGWPSRIPHEVKLKWPSCDSIFRAFNNLRVLNLTDLGMKMLPISIGGLKSLRYLDLSHNNMKSLPASIGKLRHLQTLILSYCHKLRELPNEVKHLVSLRHLEMEGCLHLTHMPSALKKLTNLQTLSHFMVSTSNSNSQKHTSGLGELVNMNNLRGQLEISHLERLKFKEPGHDGYAYLKEKEHLECLNLQWNHDEADDNNDDNNHEQISLGLLEPHPNLQQLNIRGYRGINFSQWLSSLKSLARLVLYNCSKCKYLPPLDQFSKLRVLRLERLDSLECITDQDDNCNDLGLGQLYELFIRDCPNLTSWWKGRTHNNARFGSMSRIEIRYCPKLECLPLFPDLYLSLVIEGSSVKPLLDTINYTSASNSMMPSDSDSIADSFPPLCKLDGLEIKNVAEQSPLPENWLQNFISLRYLCISEKMSLIKGFKHLSSLKILDVTNCARVDLPGDEWEGLQSLQQLTVEEVTELESLPAGVKHLTSLTWLRIASCPELTTLTEGIGHLTSLKTLKIAECKKLASLPKGMINLKSVNKLIIANCPLLLPRCQEGTGDDWPQIQHIKDVELTGTSEVHDE